MGTLFKADPITWYELSLEAPAAHNVPISNATHSPVNPIIIAMQSRLHRFWTRCNVDDVDEDTFPFLDREDEDSSAAVSGQRSVACGTHSESPEILGRHVGPYSLALSATLWTVMLYNIFPYPTTVQLFIVFLVTLVGWGVLRLWTLTATIFRGREAIEDHLRRSTISERSMEVFGIFLLAFFLAYLGITPPEKPRVDLIPNERYFIAANLYNSEGILPSWSNSLISLLHARAWSIFGPRQLRNALPV